MSENEAKESAISIRGVPAKALLNPSAITPEEVVNLAQLAIGYSEIIEAKKNDSPAVLINQLIFADSGFFTQACSAMIAPDLEPETVVDFVNKFSASQVEACRGVIHDLNLRLSAQYERMWEACRVIRAALNSDELDGIRVTPAVASLRKLLAELEGQ